MTGRKSVPYANQFDFGTSVGSQDIAILMYVGILLRGYSVYNNI